MIKLDKTELEIVETLNYKGFEVFVVGGAVRDAIMGLLSDDIDLVTNATPFQIQNIFKDRFSFDYVGTDFKISMLDGIDVSTYRKDVYDSLDALKRIDYADTIQEDLARRDFTINAIAWNPFTREIIDPYNGQQDLARGFVRFVGNPTKRINEDPNRIYRACRMVARINGLFAVNAFRELRENPLAKEVAKERIKNEILKAMKIKNASIFFKKLYEIGLLDFVFPSITRGIGHDGGRYHPETVFEHNMIAGDFLDTSNLLLKLTGYLHDCGKPAAFDLNNRSFVGHEHIGANIAEEELKRLKFSKASIKYITNLIRLHMETLELDTSGKSIRKLLSKMKARNMSYVDLLKLKIADRTAHMAKPDWTHEQICHFYEKFELELEANVPLEIKDLAINGNDVMNHFDIKPHSIINKILTSCLKHVIKFPENNKREKLLHVINGYKGTIRKHPKVFIKRGE